MNEVITKKTAYQWVIAIALAHLLLWTLPCILWRSTLPLDTTEGFAYSLQWQWGYERDPYLLTLAVALGRWLTHNQTWIFYVFSQLAVLTCFVAVWRLARAVGLSRLHALISVLCLEGIAYYNYSTPEYNDNVLILPFWAWSGYFFYQVCQNGKLRNWILLGLSAGLATMAKHSGAILVLSMLCYLMVSPVGRRHWMKPGVYVGILIAFVIVFPNILWLAEHDFVTLVYAEDRASLASSSTVWGHLLNPLKFVVSQVLVILPALILLALVGNRKTESGSALEPDQCFRLFSITALPLLLVLLSSAVSGGEFPDHWGAPLFVFLGVFFMVVWQPETELLHWRRFKVSVVLVFLMMLLAEAVSLFVLPRFQHNLRAVYPAAMVSAKAHQLWSKHFPGTPLRYVDGDRWISGNISVFAPDHPVALPYFFWQYLKSGADLKVSRNTLEQQGRMVVWFGSDADAHKQYPNAVVLGRIPFKYARTQPHYRDAVIVAAIPPGELAKN